MQLLKASPAAQSCLLVPPAGRVCSCDQSLLRNDGRLSRTCFCRVQTQQIQTSAHFIQRLTFEKMRRKLEIVADVTPTGNLCGTEQDGHRCSYLPQHRHRSTETHPAGWNQQRPPSFHPFKHTMKGTFHLNSTRSLGLREGKL